MSVGRSKRAHRSEQEADVRVLRSLGEGSGAERAADEQNVPIVFIAFCLGSILRGHRRSNQGIRMSGAKSAMGGVAPKMPLIG